MIEVKSITMNYGKTVALKNVCFKAQEGKVLGLLGPNGAGKTTLMRILTTYLYPSKGTALINGCDVVADPLAVRALIGYMPETVPLYDDMMVDEYLKFIGRARGLFSDRLFDRLRWVKECCDIGSIWKHSIGEISKGYRQRVGLAQALIHDPKVLILDEPTTGLDPLQIIAIRDLIRSLAQNKTIIFSTHILQEVEALADRIVILNNGRLVAEGTRHDIVEMASKGEKFTLVVAAPKKEIEDVLKNEEMIDAFRFGGSDSDKYVKFMVAASTGKPIVARLNEIIAQRGWQIRELKREQANLEEAFIWLLSRDLKKKDRKEGAA
ncbi:MAG: ATP-binding cassette domain-containing protein [Candidatus Omnitrophota bacterium]